MIRYLATLALMVSLVSCGGSSATPALPTAHVAIATPVATFAAHPPTATVAPTAEPTPTPVPSATPATQQAQYRAWMAEARGRHPYPEPIEMMWAVMICESQGDPDLVIGDYHGLFQYASGTWAGDWNSYRDQPILDPRAQIFATAQAWHDGHQLWWGCYGASALRGEVV
jgi:hypothetical protein